MSDAPSILNIVRAALLGHAVGDALGVSVEFTPREKLRANPVTDMTGFGTYDQPPGTWSDDTSLTLCLAESLCDGYDLADQARLFARWLHDAHWTPHGEVFDIGITTRRALERFDEGAAPIQAGPRDERSNGNGALMRILPLAVYFAKAQPATRIPLVMEASCVTHGHMRSQLACAFYVELAVRLMHGVSPAEAIAATQAQFVPILDEHDPHERAEFAPVLDPALTQRDERAISGSGYVMHTLTAALWCCLRAGAYEEAVLMAVNLGEDTDTTGAVTGGLAGLIWGVDAIPERWRRALARLDAIETLLTAFADACRREWEANA